MYASPYLVQISFWMLTIPWTFFETQEGQCLGTHFREGDEDSNFSVFRVQRFSDWPEPLHWIAYLVEILTKPLIH